LASMRGSSAAHLRAASAAQWHWTAAAGHDLQTAAWVALALGISMASWLLSRRLAGRSGLL